MLVIDSDVDTQGFDVEQLTINAYSTGRVFSVDAIQALRSC